MASFVEYRENAAECARLALIAPSETGRASFRAAAKHWMMLYRLAAESETAESSGRWSLCIARGIADRPQRQL
jgi:hypothetical protein